MYAKNHDYKYVWFKDCKIFLRKDEKNKVISIYNNERYRYR